MSLTSNTRFALFKDNMKKKVNTVLFDRVIWSSGWVVLRTFIFGGRNWRFDNLCGKESVMLFVSVGLEVRQLIREIYSTDKQSRTTNKTNGSKLTNHDRRTLLESRSQHISAQQTDQLTWTELIQFDSDDVFRLGCRNVSRYY